MVSCKPEELPPTETGTPVFSIKGGDIDITAGENDFYLFTDHTNDDSDVFSFRGRFAKTSDCVSDCKEELLVEIRNFEQTTATGVDVESALFPGNYAYKMFNPSTSEDSIVVTLTAEPEGNGPNFFQWIVNYDVDSSSITETFFTEEVVLTFSESQNVSSLDVCLEIMNNNNCQIEYCNEIYLDPNSTNCQADFYIEDNSPIFLQLKAEMINGDAPFTYMWGNGTTTDTFTLFHNGSLMDTFCVTITDASGCIDDICKSLIIQGGTMPTICGSRFSYDKTIVPGGEDSLQLSRVLIQYTDPDGVVYRSDFQEQPNSSNFLITAIEDFELNENGEKTKKLDISGFCRLFNSNGMSLDFPFEGIISVAYP